jgi:hypothetical protein
MASSKPQIVFFSSTEGKNILEELALLVADPPNKDWAYAKIWTEDLFQPGSMFLGAILETLMLVDFAVVLWTPDDIVASRGQTTHSARDNVVFETGLVIARLGTERVGIVKPREPELKLPTDLAGCVLEHYDPPPSRQLIPAALQVSKIKLKRHFRSLWDDMRAGGHPPHDVTSSPQRQSVVVVHPKQQIIPIYRSLEEEIDWFDEFEEHVKGPARHLPSRMLYYGPGLASNWINSAGKDPGNLQQLEAFEHTITELLTRHFPVNNLTGNVTIVDLGIGDFIKGAYILKQVMPAAEQQALRLRYSALDISFEMVCSALGLYHLRDNVVTATLMNMRRAGHEVFGVNAPFSQLKNYRDLLGREGRNLFLLLGNTLGNEDSEEETLLAIAEGMRAGDILLTEVQLKEDTPYSDAQLTEAIQDSKRFYAGPFITLGCPEEDVSLRVEGSANSTIGLDCWTYKIKCHFEKPFKARIPTSHREILLKQGSAVTTYIVRKYEEHSLDHAFRQAGLDIIESCSRLASAQSKRKFLYTVATKVGQ